MPFDEDQLREIAAPVGSDVPSQIVPAHCIVGGTGERIEPVELPQMVLVLVPSDVGIATGDVYAKADELGLTRPALDASDLRALATEPLDVIATHLENDLQRATLHFRPELSQTIEALLAAGALGAQVSGSGPTVFGVFADREAADAAKAQIPGALVTMVAGR
jgi:4-diphosphocytidyl-2-C-methyl-D-erythritol kinase